MGDAANTGKANGRRRSLLDLAPLERDCMYALWPLGEGTVRQIRDELAASRPRAYTTVMTIMDRLAKKGVVARRKAGRGYVYRPNFTAEEFRSHAVAQLVDHFFDGSSEALREHLGGEESTPVRRAAPPAPRPARREASPAGKREKVEEAPAPPRLDESLL